MASNVQPSIYLADLEPDESEIEMTQEELEELSQQIENMKKDFTILCCGETGVGKSTLLNGILGRGEWVEEFPVGESLRQGTDRAEVKQFKKDDITVKVWDTPGLEGGDNDDKYLQRIKEQCTDINLFLYCIDCSETRATHLRDEKSALKKYTTLFGAKKLWKNSVVALTKANAVVADLEEQKTQDSSINIEEKLKEKVSIWKDEIRKEIKRLGYKKAHKVPIVPTGSAVSPYLPGYGIWLSALVSTVIDRLNYKARLAYLKLNKDRLVPQNDIDPAAMSEQDIQDQPLGIPLKYKVLAAAAASGISIGAAAVAGATAGATIGALAIGVPSFGVFAGVGLALGGAVGAAAGIGVSVAAGLAALYYKKKKAKKESN